MRLSRRVSRFRVRRLHIVISGVLFCAIYIVLYQHTGINLPAAELDGLLVDTPLRFRVADGWAWKDDIDYSGKFTKVLTILPEKSDSNQTASDKLPPSVVQDPGVDDAQARYELEGVEDYILWHDGYLEPTKNQINRKIRSCKKPIQNILFLKTHFTGSDVITNILNRFADLWNLRVALPSGGLSTFYWPSRFNWKYVDIMLLDGTLPNILCNHARFNGDVMDQIMQPQTAFITILRDPVTHFESTFRNLDFARILEMEHLSDPYLTFIENPRKYIGRTIQRKRFKDSLNLIKNGMFFDLGLRTTDYHKPEVVQDAVLDIDDKFTVVLIFEYLDESLVLMKRKLCWELDDILYLRLHFQLYGENSHKTISTNITEQIHRWNKADVKLYQHFNETLWKDINSEGTGFSEELAAFRTKHMGMERECLGDLDFKDFTQIDLNPNVSSINRYLCEKMLFREFDYLHYFRQKMENSKKLAFVDGIGREENATSFAPEHLQDKNELENKATRKSAQMNETRHSSATRDGLSHT